MFLIKNGYILTKVANYSYIISLNINYKGGTRLYHKAVCFK